MDFLSNWMPQPSSSNKKATFMLVVLFLLGGSSLSAQNRLIPEKYLAITPGVSVRKDVEKLFSPRDAAKTFVEYDTPDFSVGVKYSLGPCDLGLGAWGFPQWTVEEVFYDWPQETRIRLSDILVNPEQFQKRQIGDVVGHDYYVNDESGISVVFDQKLNSVINIRIRPSPRFKQKFACQINGKF